MPCVETVQCLKPLSVRTHTSDSIELVGDRVVFQVYAEHRGDEFLYMLKDVLLTYDLYAQSWISVKFSVYQNFFPKFIDSITQHQLTPAALVQDTRRLLGKKKKYEGRNKEVKPTVMTFLVSSSGPDHSVVSSFDFSDHPVSAAKLR